MNNLELIRPLLNFSDDDSFYFLQIIARKKENKAVTTNSKLIKSYYINSLKYLENKMPEIINLCDMYFARAYLRLNRRSSNQCTMQMIKYLVELVLNKEFKTTHNAYNKMCGRYTNEKNRKWIVDIDESDSVNKKELITFIETLQPIGKPKFKAVLPTKNGYHIITSPFNVAEFKKLYSDIDIHKDNLVNLYIP